MDRFIGSIITALIVYQAILGGLRLHKRVRLIEALMKTASSHGYNGLIVNLS